METMTLIICGEEQELTAQEVQEQLDSLFKEIERLKKENKEKEEVVEQLSGRAEAKRTHPQGHRGCEDGS